MSTASCLYVRGCQCVCICSLCALLCDFFIHPAIFLPPAKKVGARLYFHRCLWFCPQGGLLRGGACSKGWMLLGGLQAHTQGGIWGGSGPGQHPREKSRGIRSRPTPKWEIEGNQVQAHTQGGSWGGSGLGPPDGYCCGWYASYWNVFLWYLSLLSFSVSLSLYLYLSVTSKFFSLYILFSIPCGFFGDI